MPVSVSCPGCGETVVVNLRTSHLQEVTLRRDGALHVRLAVDTSVHRCPPRSGPGLPVKAAS